jgi:elongation factor Ts
MSDRSTGEGVIGNYFHSNGKIGVMVHIACETDFVAKNDDFVALAKKFAAIALNSKDREDFMASEFDNGITVAEKIIEQTGVIGEKLEIGGFEKLSAPYVGFYIHAGNKIATIVGMSAVVDKVEVVAKDLAMQAAAMSPSTLSYKDFTPEFLLAETEARIAAIEKDNIELGRLGKTLKNVPTYISRAQLTDEIIAEAKAKIEAELKAEGKPEKIWDRIVPGKVERFIADNTTLDLEQCLLDQDFIKDGDINVATYVKKFGDVEVLGFKRVALG